MRQRLQLLSAMALATALPGIAEAQTPPLCFPDLCPRLDDIAETLNDVDDEPMVVSPPRLNMTATECATTVEVIDIIPGSDVEIFDVSGFGPGSIGSLTNVQDTRAVVTVLPLEGMWSLEARQTFNGTTSGPSNRVDVQSAAIVSPIPVPYIYPPVYECAHVLVMNQTVHGSRLFNDTLAESGMITDQFLGPAAPYPATYFPPPDRPDIFVGPVGDPSISVARQVYCQNDPTNEVDTGYGPIRPEVEPAPPLLMLGLRIDMETPAFGTIQDLFVGQDRFLVDGVEWGAAVRLEDVTAGSPGVIVGGEVAPPFAGDRIRVRVDPPGIQAGVDYEVYQELCSPGPRLNISTIGVNIRPCNEAPPPIALPPRVGATEVEITQAIEGARVRLLINGTERADTVVDTLPSTITFDPPALVAGDVIVLIQEIPQRSPMGITWCRGDNVYRRTVSSSMACNNQGELFENLPGACCDSNPRLVPRNETVSEVDGVDWTEPVRCLPECGEEETFACADTAPGSTPRTFTPQCTAAGRDVVAARLAFTGGIASDAVCDGVDMDCDEVPDHEETDFTSTFCDEPPPGCPSGASFAGMTTCEEGATDAVCSWDDVCGWDYATNSTLSVTPATLHDECDLNSAGTYHTDNNACSSNADCAPNQFCHFDVDHFPCSNTTTGRPLECHLMGVSHPICGSPFPNYQTRNGAGGDCVGTVCWEAGVGFNTNPFLPVGMENASFMCSPGNVP